MRVNRPPVAYNLREHNPEEIMTEYHHYNGWANYATWCVNQWMEKEDEFQWFWTKQADEIYRAAEPCELFDQEETAKLEFAAFARAHYHNASPHLLGESVYSSLLAAVLSEVDWHEIADNWVIATVEELDELD